MKNIDRLQLLKMRPNLINNFRILAEILYEYIPEQDKLSFACFCLDSLANRDEDIYVRNIATLAAMLPEDVQNQFLKLAIKHMNSDIERKQQKENGTMQARKPMPQHAASFSAAFILSAAGLISQYYTDPFYRNVALLSAAGCAAHGFYDLHQEGRLGRIFTPITRQWHAFWNPAEKTPAATDNKLAIPSPRL